MGARQKRVGNINIRRGQRFDVDGSGVGLGGETSGSITGINIIH